MTLWIWLVIAATAIHSSMGRPAQYETRYPQMSNDERHRMFLMHVIMQQFERVVEEGGGHGAVSHDINTGRLIDLTVHLAQWHLTPPCPLQFPVTDARLVQLFTDYYQGNRTEAIVGLSRILANVGVGVDNQ